MKDNDLLLYGALAVGGFLLYQQMSKPTVPTATSTIVPAGGTAMVTQAALPIASSSNLNTLATGLVSLFKPLSAAIKPSAATQPAAAAQAAEAAATYNNTDQQLSDEYFAPSQSLGPSTNYTIAPAGLSYSPTLNSNTPSFLMPSAATASYADVDSQLAQQYFNSDLTDFTEV